MNRQGLRLVALLALTGLAGLTLSLANAALAQDARRPGWTFMSPALQTL